MLENEEIEETLNEKETGDSQRNTVVNELENEIENVDNSEDKNVTTIDKQTVNEETVIEKIKDFIRKIVAIQEESSKEFLSDDENIEEEKKENDDTTKYLLEYYDLPYRYNETVVKILAQTPKKLFVYWDISDNDRKNYVETFGENFFNITYPVLLVYNEDMKYVKEVPINDFANSWYIDIDNPKTKYTIQLGRKFRNKPEIVDMAKINTNEVVLRTDYVPVANSNMLEAPNDHILLEYLPKLLKFRNVKTNDEYYKNIGKFKDAFGNNYNVKDFYEKYYKDEVEDDMFDMNNPTSSSRLKSKLSSSKFK